MIKIETKDTLAIIKVSGDVQHDAIYFKDYLERYVKDKLYNRIIIDFSADAIIDNIIMGALIDATHNQEQKINIVTVKDSSVDRMLILVKLTSIFKIYYSLDKCILNEIV